MNNSGNLTNVAIYNSSSFKYKSSTLGKATTAHGRDRSLKNIKIVVPLKCLPNFFKLLEMPLINCKIHLEVNWNKNCVMYGHDTYADGNNENNSETIFKITSTKLYVPIVTLSTKDNVNLTIQLNGGFKRSVYWNEYKSRIDTKQADNNNPTRFHFDDFFQGIAKLYVLAFDDTILANGKDGANRVKREL